MTPLEHHHQTQCKLPQKKNTLIKVLFRPPFTATTEMAVFCQLNLTNLFFTAHEFPFEFQSYRKKKKI